MKPIKSIFFLLAAALLAACSAPGEEEPEVIVPQDATLTLSVAPGSILTKSAAKSTTKGATDEDHLMKKGEDKINNIFAAVFREDSTLLASAYVDYANVSGATPDTIRIAAKSDTKYIYAVLVNAGKPDFTNIKELREQYIKLEDIRVDNQPMCSHFIDLTKLKPGNNYIGSTETFKDVPADAFYSTSPVSVYRTASRIDIENIDLEWREADAADLKTEGARFRLKRIYVVDAKSAAALVDDALHKVEWKEGDYKNGRATNEQGYLSTLDLLSVTEADAPILTENSSYPPVDAPKIQCYVTENTGVNPTTIILKGDILHKDEDTPILSDRYFFVRLKNMTDTQGKSLSGVLRNYVIRISATIAGRGSSDETYRENAKALATISADDWEVETQKTEVN
ncbi:fimbrial protein [Parabacteroides faecis]|uniref:fimbrial protein n=1 Tax=Parabacteroides faecis TaxID=1217282 RepID=UPI002164A4CE|nr:fimbrial protein [Parabacteroides faecis]MCS2893412.1 fimbrial protein [Parabacteroides faecis]UVQ47979.1 fimbrial protein [Parabacteroides faecis]